MTTGLRAGQPAAGLAGLARLGRRLGGGVRRGGRAQSRPGGWPGWPTRPAEPARVTRTDRSGAEVLTGAGPAAGHLGRRPAGRGGRRRQAWHRRPATSCAASTGPTSRVTAEAVLPRRTAIVRASASGRSDGQVLAANVDAVAVVESLVPGAAGRPDRAAAGAGLGQRRRSRTWCSPRPTCAPTARPWPPSSARRWLPAYPSICSLRQRVWAWPSSRLCAPAGGRWPCSAAPAPASRPCSTRCVGAEVMATNALAAIGKGRHTTVTRELHASAGGGSGHRHPRPARGRPAGHRRPGRGLPRGRGAGRAVPVHGLRARRRARLRGAGRRRGRRAAGAPAGELAQAAAGGRVGRPRAPTPGCGRPASRSGRSSTRPTGPGGSGPDAGADGCQRGSSWTRRPGIG